MIRKVRPHPNLEYWEASIARGDLRDHLPEVATLLKREAVGLLLDLDGTISEIVPHPNAASVRPPVKSVLKKLHGRLALVAIVTGRPVAQARDIVGLQELVYVGNHGLERMENGQLNLIEEARPFAPTLERLLGRLRERFPSSGLIFEDKGASFAVHYRMAKVPESARQDLLEAIDELGGGCVRVLMGKTVLNVLPPVDFNKGTAVISLAKEYGLSGAILIGDDTTDVDLFRAAAVLSDRGHFAGISIAVVGVDSPQELESEADYTLSSVSQVEDFLTWMAGRRD